ncbi:MAG TPA: hypothetical protein VNZ49_05440 [Bacteroidia bacterium]|jgi:hypothetical protein|nr:hypothetical protein [Bacteroidia bacterium]
MLRFDRTVHKSGNIKDFQKESDFYKGMSLEELADFFNYLQSVAYNFDPNKPPRLDKSIHNYR